MHSESALLGGRWVKAKRDFSLLCVAEGTAPITGGGLWCRMCWLKQLWELMVQEGCWVLWGTWVVPNTNASLCAFCAHVAPSQPQRHWWQGRVLPGHWAHPSREAGWHCLLARDPKTYPQKLPETSKMDFGQSWVESRAIEVLLIAVRL